MRVLITGIAGFVGSTLARKLLRESKDLKIIGIDNLSYGYMDRINDFKEYIDFINCDVKELIRYNIPSVDLIIHCAAIAPLPDNQTDLYRSIEQNVAMCGAISDFATRNGCENVIFFSSGAIYEGSGERHCRESDIVETKLAYPTSKYLAEQFFTSIAKTYGLKIVSIRLFNLYGPNQDYFRKQPPLLGYLIRSYLNQEPITLYASENAKRDYIYIDDLFNLINRIIHKLPDINLGSNVIVNAGSENTYSVYDIINEFESITGEKINFVKGDKSDFWNKYPEIFDRKKPLIESYLVDEVDKKSIANIQFAREYFGWEPKYNMKKGLTECLTFARGVFK